ncbi:MAG: MoxR family ATPase [Ruminococcaceae bacterium]|nr:MoxR family ATPase [Oscillospiraceae bacterium]
MTAVYRIADALCAEVGKVVTGKEREITLLVAALMAGGHVLIEDVPGVGKTTLAASLAKAAGLDFCRAQFTPDVMASDITGFNVYNRKTESFEFRPGLVNTNILLADEINRASPKTQSSLLEAMEEGRVTVDGTTYEIPHPFMVIATQNPIGFVGTYPLPEAQLDRFALRLRMGYPTPEEEIAILRRRQSGDPFASITPLPGKKAVQLLKQAAEKVVLSAEIEQYIVSLVAATRHHSALTLGASPRASLTLMRMTRAVAVLAHRHYVLPEDVADLFFETVAHRVTLSRESVAGGVSVETVLSDILSQTPVPFLTRSRRTTV